MLDRSPETKPTEHGPGPSVSGRLPGIDIIRCIAACAVLVAHATQTTTVIRPSWIALHHGLSNRVLTVVFDRLGTWGVGLFFVVSGFCIHLPVARRRMAAPGYEPPLGPYYRRRFTRIYPPHLIAMAMAGTAALLVPPGFFVAEWQQISVPTVRQVILHLLMVHSFFPSARYSINAVLWTISVETHFYLLYPLLLRALRTFRFESVIASLFFLSIASTYLVSLVDPGYATVWDENFVGRYWEWVLGAFVAEKMVRHPKLTWSRWLHFAALLLVSFALSLGVELLPEGRALRMHLRPFLFAVVVYVGARLPSVRAVGSFLYRWGLALGFRSYSLYLVHPVCMALTCVGLAALGAPLVAQWTASIALSVGATILFFDAVERPFMQRAARMSAESVKVAVSSSGS